jgi:hypothetical protein
LEQALVWRVARYAGAAGITLISLQAGVAFLAFQEGIVCFSIQDELYIF